jgi:mono/diheme cytochrome c family protein
MKLTWAVVTAVGLGIGTYSAVSAQEQEKTQWDGVYTGEQAQRGSALYAERCAQCHGDSLGGGEMAPALTGGEFAANWNDLSLGQLFDRMRISMPQDNPGSLSRQANADVLAFILQKGEYPVGPSELPTQTEVLNTIKFLAQKPGK